MTGRLTPLFLLVFCLTVDASRDFAAAGVVYDNGVSLADIDNGRLSDSGGNPNGYLLSGDEFTLVSDATISSVQWSGVYWSNDTPQATDDFTIRIYEPGIHTFSTLLYTIHVGNNVGRTDSGFDFPIGSEVDIYTYSADLGATNLLAGTYLISIANNTVVDNDDSWFWAFEHGTPGTDLSYATNGSGWTSTGGSGSTTNFIHDFRLFEQTTQPVPEPSSIALLGMGLLGMGGYVGRRKWKRSR